jgi:mannosyltransferase OCH1-like enzyme
MKTIWILVVFAVIIIGLYFFMRRRKETKEEKEGIPKIIHQTAPSDESKWRPVWKRCQQSWKSKHPEFEYRFWSDEDLDNFMKTEYPDFYHDVYQHYDQKIKKIDAVRYFILYHYGGVYADMDYLCQFRFFDDLPQDKVSINESQVGMDEGFQNALMISPKGHEFWKHVIERLKKTKDEPDVLMCTGPIVVSRTIKEFPEMANPLPISEYNPYFLHSSDKPENYPDAKAIHIHTYAWYNNGIYGFQGS